MRNEKLESRRTGAYADESAPTNKSRGGMKVRPLDPGSVRCMFALIELLPVIRRVIWRKA